MSDFPYDDVITYWVPTYGTDGQLDTSAPGVAVPAAIASRQDEIITVQGKDPEVSTLAVYTDAEIKFDWMVAVGDFDGQTLDIDAMDARRVLQVSVVPSGTNARRVLT